jgi:LuxR family transcriptional regulator, quorum-sensing system regulator SdiA
VNIHSLIQLLVVLEECKKTERVVSEVESVLHSYGFQYYVLLRHPKRAADTLSAIMAGDWPEKWSEVYAAKKYFLIDPTVRYLGQTHRPFRWRDALAAYRRDPHLRRMEQMMADAARHGLQDGYIFPVHGRNGLLGSMSIGGQPVDLSPVEMSLFEAVTRKAFWRLLELNDEAQALDGATIVDTPLTRRELEILHYLADGLTSMEISKLLTISNHTVDWYMNGLQDKLKAKNRQQAVALAFRHGLIT